MLSVLLGQPHLFILHPFLLFRMHTPNRLLQATTFFSLLLATTGCAVLTDAQRKSVADYASLTRAYTQYPSQVARSYADLYYEIDRLKLVTLNNEDINPALWKALGFHKQALGQAQRVDMATQAVNQYAQALASLAGSSATDGLGVSTALLGKNLDALVTTYNKGWRSASPLPVGFGALAANLLNLAGKRYINAKQATALRAYMSKGDTLIRLIADDTKTAFDSVKTNWIPNLHNTLAQNHQNFLNSLPDAPNRAYYAYLVNKDAVVLVEKIDSFEALADQVQRSVLSLYTAHHSVLADIEKKRSVGEQIADVQELYKAVNAMHKNYLTLVTPKP